MKPTYKVVIFDLDGTIGNTLPLCIEAFRHSVETLSGKSISDEEIIATFGPSEEGSILKLIPNAYEKGVADYLCWYEQLHDMCPKAFDGIPELITELKGRGVQLAMVTGKGVHSTRISLQRFGMSDCFDIVETGHSKGPRKEEGLRSVLYFYTGIDKKEVLYVGDAPSDILACQHTGIAIAAAAWADTACPEKLLELKPDVLFYSISEFSDWLLNP